MQNTAEMTIDPHSSAEHVISCLSTHMDGLKPWWKGYAVSPELDRDGHKCSEADQATTIADEWSAKLMSMPPGCQERMNATEQLAHLVSALCVGDEQLQQAKDKLASVLIEAENGLADATDAVTTFAHIICFIMEHSVKKKAEITDSTTAATESVWRLEAKRAVHARVTNMYQGLMSNSV